MIFWGAADFDQYEYTIGRFNSEYGMQSMSPFNSQKKFMKPENLQPTTNILKNLEIKYHNPYFGGMNTLNQYLLMNFR